MKDALGHGSEAGAHASGVDKVGRPELWTGKGSATFTVQGMHQPGDNEGDGEVPNFIEARADTATLEHAKELAGQFPKSSGVRAVRVGGMRNGEQFSIGTAEQNLRLMPTKTTGLKNEAALKRYSSFRKAADKLGHKVVYEPTMGNAYPTQDEFHKAIGYRRK